MGDPTSNYANANHSSQDHLTTQAPPLRQSRDTFGGGGIKVQNSRLYDEVRGISYRHESVKKLYT